MSEQTYKHLSISAITIQGSKNPIPMKQFLQFLTVKTKISRSNLGRCNGWIERYNEEEKLVITGGTFRGVEYLNSIEFGEKLQNPYNNYVNPFYILHLMNSDGKAFFAKYYREEINNLIKSAKMNVVEATNRIKKEKSSLKNLKKLQEDQQ